MSGNFYIVGLGNPGPEYLFTRHNAGFMVLDLIQRDYGVVFSKGKTALTAKAGICDNNVVLIKPQTYMNKSGLALKNLAIDIDGDGAGVSNLLVVYDDIYLPLGALRYRESGSDGGHNGIKSIIAALGTNKFHRLRIGVGCDQPIDDLHNFVLGNFNKYEKDLLSSILWKAKESIECYLAQGIQIAMSKFNGKVI